MALLDINFFVGVIGQSTQVAPQANRHLTKIRGPVLLRASKNSSRVIMHAQTIKRAEATAAKPLPQLHLAYSFV